MKRLILFCVMAAAAGTLMMSGAVAVGEEAMEVKEGGVGEVVKLPEPKEAGKLSLEELLRKRRSVRSFTGEDISVGDKGQLLWAAQGKTHPRGFRTAPSAGALYPLEVYLWIARGRTSIFLRRSR